MVSNQHPKPSHHGISDNPRHQALLPLLDRRPSPAHRIYSNRTLNLRSIGAIGYDMDYTLIHYHVARWEQEAFDHLQHKLVADGWPVAHLTFNPEKVMRGLVIDLELGNLVKADRFGYIRRVCHGTRFLDFDEQKRAYSRTVVDLAEPRWVFLNTFFSLSEASMYAQLVDLLDARQLPEVMGYKDLYGRVRTRLDAAHMEGRLKGKIATDPQRYVEQDPDVALALLDQLRAGKRLVLITNSEWVYSQALMRYAVESFLPRGMSWRDLFSLIIVSARKPDFFSTRMPAFEVVSDDGLLRPCTAFRQGAIHAGGHAGMVEDLLDLSGEEILFVGDHIFVDVHMSKSVLRWRTALVVRELEEELSAVQTFHPHQEQLAALMAQKEHSEYILAAARRELLRVRLNYGPRLDVNQATMEGLITSLKARMVELDGQIAPLAKASGELANQDWGLLMRAGNEKSLLARQVERYADIYMSRTTNFIHHSPYAFLRALGGSLPHDDAIVHPKGP